MPRGDLRRDLLDDLRRLARAATAQVVTFEQAAAALELSPRKATLRLAALARRHAIRKIRRGIFLVPPLNTHDRAAARIESAEALAHALYRPCYIGGWSAAVRWGLPSVARRETLIVTSARVRATAVRVEGAYFHLHRLPEPLIAGPGIVTRLGDLKVSSAERTLVDALRAPAWIGGVLFLKAALEAYRLSEAWNPDLLVEMLESAGNDAAIRRLGAITDALGINFDDVLFELRDWRRKGVIDLEPGAGKKGPVARWWRVRLNVDLYQRQWDGDDPGDHDEEYEEYLVEMDLVELESETIRERGASW